MNQGQSDAPSVVCERYSCDRPQVKVSFNIKAETQWGQNVYLVGGDPLLSDWEPDAAIALSPSGYPVWTATVSLPASTRFEYKFLKRDGQGNVLWEQGGNRVVITPPSAEAVREEVFR